MRVIHPSMTWRDVARSAAAATLTDRPLQFLRYETVSLAGPRAVTYRLRGRQVSAVVRHGSHDIDRLLAAFRRRVFEIPAEALRELRAAEHPVVLDLGAGPGMTALALLSQLPGARVTSVEPDPISAVILRRTMRANPRFTGWSESVAAVGDGAYLRGPGYGRFGPKMTEQRRSAQAPPLDPSGLIAGCDVLALNVQGAEWAMLAEGQLADSTARVVFLEPHRRGCPEPDAVAGARRLLTRAGFRIASRAVGPKVVLCAWRPGRAAGRG